MQYARGQVTSGQRRAVQVGRGPLGCGCSVAPVGTVELPPIDWKQIGVGVIIGLGFGYVLFATK